MPLQRAGIFSADPICLSFSAPVPGSFRPGKDPSYWYVTGHGPLFPCAQPGHFSCLEHVDNIFKERRPFGFLNWQRGCREKAACDGKILLRSMAGVSGPGMVGDGDVSLVLVDFANVAVRADAVELGCYRNEDRATARGRLLRGFQFRQHSGTLRVPLRGPLVADLYD